MKVRIEVTREHIEKWQRQIGINQKGSACAIDMALGQERTVCTQQLIYQDRTYRHSLDLERWINDIDGLRPVQPFTLLLDTEKLTAEMETAGVSVEDCVVCDGTGKLEVIKEKEVVCDAHAL